MAGCCAALGDCTARIVGDADKTFGYSTLSRTVIRDKRLGFLHAFLALCIVIYVFVYQIAYVQQYRKEGGIVGTARMQLQAPAVRTAQPAFCLGVNASSVSNNSAGYYSFPQPGLYAFGGPGGSAVPALQGSCAFMDAFDAVPDSLANSALLLSTRITLSTQQIEPLPRCERLAFADCAWATTSTEVQYIPDPEFFTLLVDHSFSALLATMSRSSADMEGFMVGPNGDRIDPCDAYTTRGMACPSFIAVGVANKPDIFALQSLLDAVGIANLDEVGGERGGLSNETLRYAGVVILLSISYSNFYLPATFSGSTLLGTNSFNGSRADYSYRVSIVPNSEFKAEASDVNYTSIPGPQRTLYNRHGIRLVVTQTGRIGVFDVQVTLINLVVAFGLLAVATAVVDFIAFNLCPLRALYSQYAQRTTVSLSEILASLPPASVKLMLEDFKRDEHLVDPVPAGVARWQLEAARIAADRAALAAAYKSSAGGGSAGDGSRQRRLNIVALAAAVGSAGGGGGGGSSASSDATVVETEAPTMVLRNRGAGKDSPADGGGVEQQQASFPPIRAADAQQASYRPIGGPAPQQSGDWR